MAAHRCGPLFIFWQTLRMKTWLQPSNWDITKTGWGTLPILKYSLRHNESYLPILRNFEIMRHAPVKKLSIYLYFIRCFDSSVVEPQVKFQCNMAFCIDLRWHLPNMSVIGRSYCIPYATNGKVRLRSLSNPHSCILSIIETVHSSLCHYIILLEQRFWLLYSPGLDSRRVWIMASTQEPPIGWPHPFMGLLSGT